MKDAKEYGDGAVSDKISCKVGWELRKNPWLVGLDGGDMVGSGQKAKADVTKTGCGDGSLGDGLGVR